jgi:hypothetical protein
MASFDGTVLYEQYQGRRIKKQDNQACAQLQRLLSNGLNISRSYLSQSIIRDIRWTPHKKLRPTRTAIKGIQRRRICG